LCIVKNGNGGITLLIGTGAGVVTGVLFGLAQGDDSPGLFSRTAEEKAKICGLIFGSIGTVIGCVHVAFNNKDETIKLDGANQVILLSVEARLASMSSYKTIQHGI